MNKAELEIARIELCNEIETLLPTEQIYVSELSLQFVDPIKYLDEQGNISHPNGGSYGFLRPGHYTQLPLDALIGLRDWLVERKLR
jgi:hypothetical protein